VTFAPAAAIADASLFAPRDGAQAAVFLAGREHLASPFSTQSTSASEPFGLGSSSTRSWSQNQLASLPTSPMAQKSFVAARAGDGW
jgi:hypothetical protein